MFDQKIRPLAPRDRALELSQFYILNECFVVHIRPVRMISLVRRFNACISGNLAIFSFLPGWNE